MIDGTLRPPLKRPLVLAPKPDPNACEHDWQLYKQSLGADQRMRRHTLIIRGCNKCHIKRAVDLKVET